LEILYSRPSECLLPEIHTDRVILRQLLIQILGNAIRSAHGGRLALALASGEGEVQLQFAVISHRPEARRILDRSATELGLTLGARLEETPGPGEDELRICLHLPVKRWHLALLIDNDRDLGDLFRRYLVGENWDLVAVQNADDGLRSAMQLHPDVVILDVIMPDRDGWDMLAQLRSSPQTQDIPVIVCSVLPQPELALRLGADVFLPKPVDQLTLLKALRALEPERPESPKPRI
jgi:CheY-like chemotaxis protein